MPLYEYRCSKCGKVFEVLQKFSDQPLATHPECGGAVERLLSASSFQLKGGGWYATDYAKSGSKPEAKGEGKSESEDSKPESKPAEKSSDKSSGSESKAETKSAPAETKPAPAKTA